ncbi:serine/threonine-protein phosphatase 7 long form homolog isoform X1 [Capsicum annuum]|uniref:serine/threonine-protein phosphatase 7 long form homolog isoform X1 n=1 Tax=Capsicum annuum TaxID=4072 RepID=UPI001FB14FE3|nr:serine/threonine-protein phosphatase 7 long form homolog isoform X1 [Capsicum annuum]XP_047254184.1 serine/threonine-protein phosphatase 7 long form homolog isoform X1 [Capsicum annuum]
MQHILHPGTIDKSLLKLQASHRSQKLWNENIDCNEAVEPKICDAAWTFFDNRPHQRVIEYISRVGLWDVVRVGKIQLDHSLITAMIEQWRPETYTFHLPYGEVTMTLQDVQILFGLRVEGLPVVFPNLLYRNFDWDRLLQVHTGFAPAPGDFTGNILLNISVLIKYIRQQVNQDPITDATLDDRVLRIARLLMLLILGAILFPNTSGSSLSLRFLNFVIDLDLTGTYSWGSAVLAYLYWCLCRIPIDGIKLGGFLPLLQLCYLIMLVSVCLFVILVNINYYVTFRYGLGRGSCPSNQYRLVILMRMSF